MSPGYYTLNFTNSSQYRVLACLEVLFTAPRPAVQDVWQEAEEAELLGRHVHHALSRVRRLSQALLREKLRACQLLDLCSPADRA